MLASNEYFNGKVKSIALTTEEGPATVGVMEIGEYDFSTSKIEVMVIISGSLNVKLPGETEFKTMPKDSTFEISANETFQVIAKEESAYICYYR